MSSFLGLGLEHCDISRYGNNGHLTDHCMTNSVWQETLSSPPPHNTTQVKCHRLREIEKSEKDRVYQCLGYNQTIFFILIVLRVIHVNVVCPSYFVIHWNKSNTEVSNTFKLHTKQWCMKWIKWKITTFFILNLMNTTISKSNNGIDIVGESINKKNGRIKNI